MLTTKNKAVSEEVEQTLQLKRSLVPIDKYAAHRNVSRGTVERCGKLGIVQVRRYKGEMFIVDVPLSPYSSYRPESTARTGQPVDKASYAKKLSQLVKKAGIIGLEVIKQPAKSVAKSAKAVAKPAAVENSDVKTPKAKGRPVQTQVDPDSSVQPGVPGAAVRPKRALQIAVYFSAVSLLAILLTSLWFITDRKAQLRRLDWANTNVRTMHNNAMRARQMAQTFQTELNDSAAQIEYLQKDLDESKANVERLRLELNKSRAQVQSVRSELNLAGQNHDAVQQGYAEAIDKLNKRIQELADQVPELME